MYSFYIAVADGEERIIDACTHVNNKIAEG